MNRAVAAVGLVFLLNVALYASQANQKTIKDQAEYNAYITALNTQDPRAKAAAMEAFFSQYPASVMKVDALEQAMAAYQQAGEVTKVGQTADRILQIDPSSVRALAIAAFLKRTTATANGDTKLAQDAGALAQRGLAALAGWTKPEETSDAEFQKLRNQMAVIFHGAAGFAAMQAKNFASARDSYLKSVQIDPNNMQDVYQLGLADLQMTPLDVNGFWYAARAISLAQTQNNQRAANGIAEYGKAMYRRYHGNLDGWDQLVASAANQTAPPANFAASIKKAPTPAEVACLAVAQNDPDTLSFSDREFILQFRDAAPCNKEAADKVWASILNMEKHGAAKLQIPVKVISADSKNIEAAITEENQSANKADLRVVMEKPLAKPPAAGAMVEVIGVIAEYTPNPFMFFMEKGALPEKK